MSKNCYEQNLIPCQSLNQYWENYLSPQYGIEDLDHDSIYKTIAEAFRENRIPAYAMREGIEEILVRLQLIEDGKIKNAALVLFAKDHVYLPQCQIKMARFRGVDKLGDFYDNQRVSGNVFKLLDAADAFLRRHLPISSTFKSDQLRRIDQPALPVMATREALVNALCHRDYADQNTDFSLAVFDDRLELWNSGTLPHKLIFSSLKKSHESIPRNKLIAHVFYIRDLIEKWGTGTNKIVSLCQDDGLPEPEFSERTGGFLVTFYFKSLLALTYLPRKMLLATRK